MHFGFHSSLILLSSIGFNNLYTKLSIRQSILDYIRTCIDGYGYYIQEKFSEILKKKIGDYYVNCFRTCKNLAYMHSKQIDEFILLILDIIIFFQESFE